MGKSGGKQQVSDYLGSLHLGVATRVDELTGIYVDKKTAWEGVVSTATVLNINLPNLNGGPKKAGGLVGSIQVLPGAPDQVMPEALAARLGRTSATCPAFRGLLSLFFYGSGRNKGFLWSSNNPVVAQNVSARVFRAPKGLDSSLATISTTVSVTTNHHTETDGTITLTRFVVGTDPGVTFAIGDTQTTVAQTVRTANPAHIIYEVMTDVAQGMGAPSEVFAHDTFTAAAQTLHDEGLGLAMMWTQQSTVEDFVNEVLNHIQGVVFLDPQTGLWNLKLIRADYDPAALPVFTPDNADMSNFQRKLWGETINEIAGTWTNPINEAQETVSVQDIGNIAIQGGIVTDSRNYYGVRTAALVTKLITRDLRSASAPLRAMEMKVDRSAWLRKPGEVIKVTWPENRLEQVIMRIGKVDYGKAGDASVKIALLEDIFALDQVAITTSAPGSTWNDPATPPAALDNVAIFTLPAFFALTADLQADSVALAYPEVLAGVLGYTRSRDTIDYDLQGQTTDAVGTTSFTDIGTKTLVERATLATALVAEAVSTFPDSIVHDTSRGPQVGGFAFIGHTDADIEIALISGLSGGTWTIKRGVLDTVPTAWAIGTPIWFVNPGARIVDTKLVRAATEVVDYKMLPRTSLGTLAIGSASTQTATMTARPHLPLRPANVKVNGNGFGSFAIGVATTLAITWATRNRALEEGQAVLWTDGPVAPEYLQQTIVTVKDSGGVTVYQQTGLWTENSLSLPVSNFDHYPDIFITVSSRREGLDSLFSSTIHVTGLANNGAAPLPPAPPTVTTAPSPVATPGAVWTAAGTALDNGAGVKVPAIQISGTQDVADVEDLIVQYRVHGTTDWFQAPSITLQGAAIKTYIAPVTALTDYDVQVAYQAGYGTNKTVISAFESLGHTTTGNATVAPSGVTSFNTRTGAVVLLLADVIAALTFTPFDASATLTVLHGGTGATTAGGARTNLGLVIGTDVQAYNANLTTYGGIAPSANVQTLLGAANFAAFRTSLGVAIGTDVQAYSANLTTYAGIAPSANVQTLLGAANYAAFRTSLNLVIGTDVQAYSATLTTYGGIAPSANVQTLLGAANFAAFRTSLGLGTAATLDFDIDGTLAANSDTKIATQKAVKTYVSAAVTAAVTFAVAADLNTGTDTGKAVNSDALAGSNFGRRVVQIQLTDPAGAALTTGDGKAYFDVPSELNGMNLVGVAAKAVGAVSTSGLPTFQVANVTDGVDMLSTSLTIDANEASSRTAAAPAVIDAAHDDVATDDTLRIDCDVAGTGAKGLIVTLEFQLP